MMLPPFPCRDDIRICRNPEGRKCRLGEGGFGVVYKALMNGVDEVAVKLVKADKPTQKEMSLFHKEVRLLILFPQTMRFCGVCWLLPRLMLGGQPAPLTGRYKPLA